MVPHPTQINSHSPRPTLMALHTTPPPPQPLASSADTSPHSFSSLATAVCMLLPEQAGKLLPWAFLLALSSAWNTLPLPRFPHGELSTLSGLHSNIPGRAETSWLPDPSPPTFRIPTPCSMRSAQYSPYVSLTCLLPLILFNCIPN